MCLLCIHSIFLKIFFDIIEVILEYYMTPACCAEFPILPKKLYPDDMSNFDKLFFQNFIFCACNAQIIKNIFVHLPHFKVFKNQLLVMKFLRNRKTKGFFEMVFFYSLLLLDDSARRVVPIPNPAFFFNNVICPSVCLFVCVSVCVFESSNLHTFTLVFLKNFSIF